MLLPIKKAHPISNRHKKSTSNLGTDYKFHSGILSDVLFWHSIIFYLASIWISTRDLELAIEVRQCPLRLAVGRRKEGGSNSDKMTFARDLPAPPPRIPPRHATAPHASERSSWKQSSGRRWRPEARQLAGFGLDFMMISWWFHGSSLGFHWDLMGFKWDLMVISNMMIYWEY